MAKERKTVKEAARRKRVMSERDLFLLENMSGICAGLLLLMALVVLLFAQYRSGMFLLILVTGCLLNVIRFLCNLLHGRIILMMCNGAAAVLAGAIAVWLLISRF